MKLEQIRAANPHSIVNLSGTFPITFKGNFGRKKKLDKHFSLTGVSYNLPLHVRILPDFPVSSPVVFLVPTPDMAIVKQHKVCGLFVFWFFPLTVCCRMWMKLVAAISHIFRLGMQLIVR